MQRLNEKFIKKLELIYLKEEIEKIKKGFSNIDRKTVFRVNKLKKDFDAIKELKELGFVLEKINFLDYAYKIISNWKIRLSQTKAFKNGYIYLQWITSQIPIELIELPKKLDNFKALDLTAAPGWKTSQLAVKLNNYWKIIANELNNIRLEKLKYTIKNQWVRNTEIINFDAIELKNYLRENSFDLIIADLPCSAEWRINLNKEKTYKYLQKVWINKRNYKLQQDIIKNTISLLKSWWELIYSTCTLDPLENEGIVHYILSNFSEMEIVDIDDYFNQDSLKNILKQWIKSYKKYIFKKEVSKSIRLLPFLDNEWFFVVKFRKKA